MIASLQKMEVRVSQKEQSALFRHWSAWEGGNSVVLKCNYPFGDECLTTEGKQP